MQNQDDDTEWNDVLRSKGILPAKPKEAEVTEEQIVSMVENAIEQKLNGEQKQLAELDIEDLDELEDSEDEAVLLEYRKKRIAELKALADKAKFGSVREISGQDYISEVNKAGEGIWVVLHLYEKGIPQCALINQFMNALASQFPATKFLRAIAKTCIPNFPEKNLPSVFIYFEGQMRKQLIGPIELRGEKLTCDEFEYMLGREGAVSTKIKEDPRPKIRDKMLSDLQDAQSEDWD